MRRSLIQRNALTVLRMPVTVTPGLTRAVFFVSRFTKTSHWSPSISCRQAMYRPSGDSWARENFESWVNFSIGTRSTADAIVTGRSRAASRRRRRMGVVGGWPTARIHQAPAGPPGQF